MVALLFCRNKMIILPVSCQKIAETFTFALYSVNKASMNKHYKILVLLVTLAFFLMLRCGGL